MCWAFWWTCRYLLAINRALLAIYRALLAVNRALLAIYRALLAINRALLAIYRDPLAIYRALSQTLRICWALWWTRRALWRYTGLFCTDPGLFCGHGAPLLQRREWRSVLRQCWVLLRICSIMRCVATCCSVLQRVAVCCNVLQCVATCCSVLRIDNALWRLFRGSFADMVHMCCSMPSAEVVFAEMWGSFSNKQGSFVDMVHTYCSKPAAEVAFAETWGPIYMQHGALLHVDRAPFRSVCVSVDRAPFRSVCVSVDRAPFRSVCVSVVGLLFEVYVCL